MLDLISGFASTVANLFRGKPAEPLPAGVDLGVQDAMTAGQLQELLRQDFTGPILKNAVVQIASFVTPWMLNISGVYQVYGEHVVYETELDIRLIESADDFLLLVSQLNKSFEQAASQVGRP